MTDKASKERRAGEERSLAMILPVVDRLRQAVEAENRELSQRTRVDYMTHSARKSQGLMELSRLRPTLLELQSNPKARAAIAELSAQIDQNQRLLGVQLKAARTVSDIVARAIREGQSDGTYSPHPWRDDER